jgi:hypothetical protein
MEQIEAPLQRWEIAASAIATLIVTLSAIVQEDTASLLLTMRAVKASSWWLSAIVAIPLPVWWVLTAAAGVALFWYGLRLARRRGAPWLFLAPAVMLLAQFAVPWLVYSPIRALTPGSKG